MALTLITGPAAPVVTLDELKEFIRFPDTDEDETIEGLIAAVTAHLEGRDGWLGRAFVTQTWELVIDRFPPCELKIPLPPLQSVTSVKYDDPAGNEQTLATDRYTVDIASVPGWIVPNLATPWPATLHAINAVCIRFVCGYPADGNSPPDLAANVPAPIKVAIKRLVATHFAQRETVVIGQTAIRIPDAAQALLAPYRVWL